MRAECEACLPSEPSASFSRASKAPKGSLGPKLPLTTTGVKQEPATWASETSLCASRCPCGPQRGERGCTARGGDVSGTRGTHKRLKTQQFTPCRNSPPCPCVPCCHSGVAQWELETPFSPSRSPGMRCAGRRGDLGISYPQPPPCGSRALTPVPFCPLTNLLVLSSLAAAPFPFAD